MSMPASFGSFALQRTKDPSHRSLRIRTFMLLFSNKPPGRLFQGWLCSTGMIKSVCQSCLPRWSQDGCGSSGLCTHSYMTAFQSRVEREGQGPLPIHFFFTQGETFPRSPSAVFSLHPIGQSCVTCPVPDRDEWNYSYSD